MLPATMKALVKERAGPSFVYKEVPLPTPHGDDLLVKVGKVALCGSDINLYEWNNGMFHMLCVLMAYGWPVHRLTFMQVYSNVGVAT